MGGTVLCTTGAFACSLCIMVSVIVIFRNSPVRALPARRGVLHHLQIVAVGTPCMGLQLMMADTLEFIDADSHTTSGGNRNRFGGIYPLR
ncbi:hypothetical protein BS47DRAFT_1337176, partial [Hydnum rufescens UP504]